jgi:two-component system, cell cycle response regulator
MSLRVLLADESSTIKKVMQLALQDFEVEVKAVPVGLDVLEVTRAFCPDLIFADVLLSKRNGYEVSAELKADPELKKIPIILMWSGFMELDEAKAQFSKADRRLEKPFDADTLRNMVRELVPKTQENLISPFLTFPHLPDIEESQPAASAPKDLKPPPPIEEDEPEEFQNVPLPKIPDSSATHRTRAQAEPWAHQDLGKFKIPLNEEDLTMDYELGATDLTKSSIAMSSGFEEIPLDQFTKSAVRVQVDPIANQALGPSAKQQAPVAPPLPNRAPKPAAIKAEMTGMIEAQMHQMSQSSTPTPGVTPGTSLPSMTTLSHERMEQVLREQVREVLEGIAWKVLPDLAERIIREEIQKLMKESENL